MQTRNFQENFPWERAIAAGNFVFHLLDVVCSLPSYSGTSSSDGISTHVDTSLIIAYYISDL